jgi:hypothetical protein
MPKVNVIAQREGKKIFLPSVVLASSVVVVDDEDDDAERRWRNK